MRGGGERALSVLDGCEEKWEFGEEIEGVELEQVPEQGISTGPSSMVPQTYLVNNVPQKVRAYVRTCDTCQPGKADTHLKRGNNRLTIHKRRGRRRGRTRR